MVKRLLCLIMAGVCMVLGMTSASLTSVGTVSADTIHQVPLSPHYPDSNKQWYLYQFEGSGYQQAYTDNVGTTHDAFSNTNCGPASAAMVMNYLRGKGLSTTFGSFSIAAIPDVKCAARGNYSKGYLQTQGFPSETYNLGYQNTDWSYPGAESEQIRNALFIEGINSHVVSGADYADARAYMDAIESAIDAGSVVIACVDPREYISTTTTSSHWTVIYGYDDTQVYLNDPGWVRFRNLSPIDKSEFEMALWNVTPASWRQVIVVDTEVANGPDYFGYTFADTKGGGGPTYDWIDITTTGTPILPSSDDYYVDGIPVGFFFNFYGDDYSQVSITNNGIVLASGGTGQYINQPIGSSTPHNFILPFWDDIVTWGNPAGAVYYQTIGTAPNRTFVVEWYDNQHYYSSTSGITFEAILYEGTNNIKFQYQDVDFGTVSGSTPSDLPPYNDGGSATTGIEGPSGQGLQYSYNQEVITPGLAILFKFPAFSGTNMYLSKNAPSSLDHGNDMTYNLYYHNFGSVAASNVVLQDTLPSDVDFVSASDGGVYDAATHTVTWSLGTVATFPAGRGSQTVTVSVPDTVSVGTVIQNTASISTSTLETRYDDDTASASTRVAGSGLPPGVGIEGRRGDSIYYGDPITFTYRCEDATGVGITIHIDDGGADITGSMTGGPPVWSFTTTFYPRYGHATVTFREQPCSGEPEYNTPFISNVELTDYSSMTTEQVRQFLASHGSYFSQPIQDVDGVIFDPPSVIAQAANQYHINPEVLITTLQKESSGVTRSTRPSNATLAFLMGCVAPSTARQQLTGAAERFRAYYDQLSNTGSTVSGWQVGVAKTTVDGVSVTPATKAVAGQFTYTPYAGAQWGGNDPGVGGVYLFYHFWMQFGFGSPVDQCDGLSFDIYIDPAGYIYDIDTNDRIAGASVWLQRPDGTGGWENVPTGEVPAAMQPDTNPLITGIDGQYQWDVLEGSYRVHVEAPGYYPADSIAVTVPPAVTDLHVGLTRLSNEAPVSDAGPDQVVEQTSPAGAEVTLNGSGSSDPDGDAITYEWTWAGGSASGETPVVVLSAGITDVTVEVSDGVLSDTDVVSITVQDTMPPSVAMVSPPSGYALQDGVTFAASATDSGSGVNSVTFSIREADGGDGVDIGFEDLPAIQDPSSPDRWSLLFDTLQLPDGCYVVLVEATDNAGNATSATDPYTVPYSIRNWAALTITVVGKGSVSRDPDQTPYTYGTGVTLTAKAASGWTFVGWSGDLSGNTNPVAVTMDGDKAITATFIVRTKTLLCSAPNPSAYGQRVTFTALVLPLTCGSGMPKGTVTFKDAGMTLGTGTLNAWGVATFSTSSLSLGKHSITATYEGGVKFNGSTSSALSQKVKACTTVKVVSSTNPSVYRQSVTFTATVVAKEPGTGVPTGKVTFKDGYGTLGTSTLDATGHATYSTSSLYVGAHCITAVYVGDDGFCCSTSSVLSQSVKRK